MNLPEVESLAVSIINDADGDKGKIVNLIAKHAISDKIKGGTVKTLCQKVNMFRLHQKMAKYASPQIDLVSLGDVIDAIKKAKNIKEAKDTFTSQDYDMEELIRHGKTENVFRPEGLKHYVNKDELKSAADFYYKKIVNEYDTTFSKYLYSLGKVHESEDKLKRAVDKYIDYEGKVPEVIKIIKEATDNDLIRKRVLNIAKVACTSVDLRKFANSVPDVKGYINWADPFPSNILEYINNLKGAAQAKKAVESISKEMELARVKLDDINAL